MARWLRVADRTALAVALFFTLSASAATAQDYARPEMLVTTEWVAAHLGDPDLRLVELRRAGAEDYAKGHIPGALHVLNDALRDPKNPPTFLPSPEAFERLMGELGISKATRVVAYDDRGGLYAARLWWLLNYFGHPNVALMDGHLIKWQKEGRPLDTQAVTVAAARFDARPNPAWLATADDVLAAIGQPTTRIVDARTHAEREGQDLRGIRRGGVVPSSVPLYWEDTLEPEARTLKSASALAALAAARGVTADHEVITYCQVGMRASHDAFVLRLIGYDRVSVYLGSWEEWGNRDDLPVATVK